MRIAYKLRKSPYICHIESNNASRFTPDPAPAATGEYVMTTELTTAQITDIVAEWESNNPERLGCLYGDTTAHLSWKHQAAERVAANPSKNAEDVLSAYAFEVEDAAERQLLTKRVDDWNIKTLAAEDNGFLVSAGASGGEWYGPFYSETEAQRARNIAARRMNDDSAEYMTLVRAAEKADEE
jgi:hypothetical protein